MADADHADVEVPDQEIDVYVEAPQEDEPQQSNGDSSGKGAADQPKVIAKFLM